MTTSDTHSVHIDDCGVLRFVGNPIVRDLLDGRVHDMNSIALGDYTIAQHQEFARLIGYSLSGYQDLSYVNEDDSEMERCDKIQSECEETIESQQYFNKTLGSVENRSKALECIAADLELEEYEDAEHPVCAAVRARYRISNSEEHYITINYIPREANVPFESVEIGGYKFIVQSSTVLYTSSAGHIGTVEALSAFFADEARLLRFNADIPNS
jgi:hypothetical protein